MSSVWCTKTRPSQCRYLVFYTSLLYFYSVWCGKPILESNHWSVGTKRYNGFFMAYAIYIVALVFSRSWTDAFRQTISFLMTLAFFWMGGFCCQPPTIFIWGMYLHCFEARANKVFLSDYAWYFLAGLAGIVYGMYHGCYYVFSSSILSGYISRVHFGWLNSKPGLDGMSLAWGVDVDSHSSNYVFTTPSGGGNEAILHGKAKQSW